MYGRGLSIFVSKTINFKFYAKAKEDRSSEEIKENISNLFKKYKTKYSDSEEATEILNELFKKNVGF